ncbi:hypothetical protein DDI_1196 [Dickeya dianthicola RNS04.9]|nr:hypothetical protein DDI_1196 [Dickeya dianthicola RNS04.9]
MPVHSLFLLFNVHTSSSWIKTLLLPVNYIFIMDEKTTKNKDKIYLGKKCFKKGLLREVIISLC